MQTRFTGRACTLLPMRSSRAMMKNEPHQPTENHIPSREAHYCWWRFGPMPSITITILTV
ncbi:hypothetical protein KCP70_22735 [Salmonella enterica subsp. enterica]|nr:hypothetical protein KCP70_22735 [Salmonella enterica subsp. enterica]